MFAARMDSEGSIDCDRDPPDSSKGDVYESLKQGECVWIQFWVQLDDASKVRDYEAFLANYSNQQHAAGQCDQPAQAREQLPPRGRDGPSTAP